MPWSRSFVVLPKSTVNIPSLSFTCRVTALQHLLCMVAYRPNFHVKKEKKQQQKKATKTKQNPGLFRFKGKIQSVPLLCHFEKECSTDKAMWFEGDTIKHIKYYQKKFTIPISAITNKMYNQIDSKWQKLSPVRITSSFIKQKLLSPFKT